MQLHRRARLDEAAALYRELLQSEPQNFDALNLLGNILLRQGRSAEALAIIGEALTLNPHSIEAQMNFGYALSQEDRLDEALASFRQAVEIRPDFAEAHAAVAMMRTALDQLDEAIESYGRVIELEPDNAQAHNNLGIVLGRLGHFEKAVTCYQRAISIEPSAAEPHNNLGVALKRLDRHEEATAAFRQTIEIAPDFSEAHNNLGSALGELGRVDEAVASYQRAIDLWPDYAEAHANLGMLQLKSHRLDAAMISFRKALAIAPDIAEAHNGLGIVLTQARQVDDAMGHYRQALTLKPDYAEAYNNLGTAFKMVGRVDEALQAIETAIRLAPTTVEFLLNLSEVKRFTEDDPHLAAMEELARTGPPQSADGLVQLHFALGKAFADLEKHEQSFRHLLAGNALKRRQVTYDEGVVLGRFERTSAVCTPELLQLNKGHGHPSPVPVFILGMPRSGTTLVEQILASHPMVFGAGELADLADIVAHLGDSAGAPVSFPEVIPTLSARELRALGERYLERVRAQAPAALRITDKMPANFRFVGFIHLMFPNARIIHTRRDPVDTCLSCFSLLFTGDQPHTYNLGELGRYYRAYAALMNHWRRVLPPGVMLEVQYEDVVTDVEREARRIVAHCRLDWDDACLEFHKTQRPVQTASMLQVRRPIYQSSIGRWRRYGDMLAPLFSALGFDLAGDLDSA